MAAAGTGSAFTKIPSSYNVPSISYANGYFVTSYALTANTLQVYTSTNGVVWSDAGWTITGSNPTVGKASYNSTLSQYIVKTGDGAAGSFYSYTIPNPLVSPSSYPSYNAPTAVNASVKFSYVNSEWVVLSDVSVSSSTTGTSWTLKNSSIFGGGVTNGVSPVMYGAGVYVAVSNAKAAYSSDLITWTASSPFGSSTIYNATWTGSRFVAVGSGGVIYTSADGISWTLRVADSGLAANTLYYIDCDTTRGIPYVAGLNVIKSSSDNGVTWSANKYPTGVPAYIGSLAVSPTTVVCGMNSLGYSPYFYLVGQY